ncbi:MAG: phosphoribosylanthranilate isomerase [Chloroflexi bacterium]|nr:phosphoribosylanthranilate isomerase [Chloroflexota bacterium]
MTKVKICGLQDLPDALAAAKAGADFLGLVFVPTAPRRLAPEKAREIVRGVRERRQCPRLVGLFADQPLDEVRGIARELALDYVQLCGSEGLRYCLEVGLPVMKTIHVDEDISQGAILPVLMANVDRHHRAGHLLVLEKRVPGAYGGTGQAFDWSIARWLARSYPISLAGGLTPENVARAVREVAPWCVDVSSGVETDGHKDSARIRAFVEAVRAADRGRGRLSRRPDARRGAAP